MSSKGNGELKALRQLLLEHSAVLKGVVDTLELGEVPDEESMRDLCSLIARSDGYLGIPASRDYDAGYLSYRAAVREHFQHVLLDKVEPDMLADEARRLARDTVLVLEDVILHAYDKGYAYMQCAEDLIDIRSAAHPEGEVLP